MEHFEKDMVLVLKTMTHGFSGVVLSHKEAGAVKIHWFL